MFSYEPKDIPTTVKYRVRFILGDTRAPGYLDDDEIDAAVAVYGLREGAAKCADSIALKLAAEPEKYKDEAGVDIAFADRVEAWRQMGRDIRSGKIKVALTSIGGAGVLKPIAMPETSGVLS